MNKVLVELKQLLKLTIGHDGYSGRDYYGEDYWQATFFGETIRDLALQVSKNEYYVLKGTHSIFKLQSVEVLEYEGVKHTHKILDSYSPYTKPIIGMLKEYVEFNELMCSDTEIADNIAHLILSDRKKKSILKSNEEKEKQRTQDIIDEGEYERLKEKYGNLNNLQ